MFVQPRSMNRPPTRGRFMGGAAALAALAALAVMAVLWAGLSIARAQQPPAAESAPPDPNSKPAAPAGPAPATPDNKPAEPGMPLNFDAPAETHVEMKSTELGVRFTPRLAEALGKQMARQMGRQYELSDEQVDKARQIISRNLMKMAQEHQDSGREAMELFMANMIENDGAFTKADGQRWAKLMRPFMEDFRKFAGTTASQVGQMMTLSQRLRLTRDVAAFSAGLSLFESRLKSWEKGDLPDMANPFFEPDSRDNKPARGGPQGNGPARAEDNSEVGRARRRAERRLDFETNVEERWKNYVESAITYYEFNEAQATGARAVLRDFLERARQLKNDEWKERIRQNRTAANLSFELPDSFRNGPWMWRLDHEYEDLLRPLQDLGRDLRARVDDLADSTQRAKAADKARSQLGKSGLELPPM
ncbi:MAG: hypothetical protein U1A27_06950 [Phycisphaerae bacterium]